MSFSRVILALLLCPSLLFAQSRPIAMSATNGVSFGRMIVNDHFEATNTSRTNIITGRVIGAGSVSSGAGGWAPGLNSRAGQYSLVSGVGNNGSGTAVFVSGLSNVAQSSAQYSLVGGMFNSVDSQGSFVVGSNNMVGGPYSSAIGMNMIFDSSSQNSIGIGRDIQFFQSASNSFAWNGAASPLLVTRSNTFHAQSPVGFYFTGGGAIYGDGSGLAGIPSTATPAALTNYDTRPLVLSNGNTFRATNGWFAENVKFWGAVGDGVVDDTAAIQRAIDNAPSKVIFPAGKYRITDTLVLRSCFEVQGIDGGSVLPDLEHPTTRGVSLIWGGSASKTMVLGIGVASFKWHGVDLDGIDITNLVTGFEIYSTNNPVSQNLSFEHFYVFNCATSMVFGATSGAGGSGTQYQTDSISIRDFMWYKCYVGLVSKSQNALQNSLIERGRVTPYDIGFDLQRCGGDLNFLAVDGNGIDASASNRTMFKISAACGTVEMNNVHWEGETNWYNLVLTGANYDSPIKLFNSTINRDVNIEGNRIFISMGNSYNTTGSGVILSTDSKTISIGDSFVSGGFVGPGTNYLNKIDRFSATFSTPVYSKDRIGVRTMSPQSLLDVVNATTGAPATSGTTDSAMGFRVRGGDASLDVGVVNTGTIWMQGRYDLDFSVNFPISLSPNGGGVGIGTLTPSQSLTVNGSAGFTNGIASFSSVAPVAIASTGWTNIWSTNNAVVSFDGTTIFYTNKLRASTPYYTNTAALGHAMVILQPGESVDINGTGVTGVAKPF